MTTSTKTPKAPTFFRQTAKETIAIAQASTDVKGLADRLAFIATRIASFQVKGQKAKEQRWTRVSKVLADRIAFLEGHAVAPKKQPARANMTFTGAPKKAKKAAKKSELTGIDAILAASGMTAQDLLLELASRV